MVDSRSHVTVPIHGRYDLDQAIGFGFGQRAAEHGDALHLAFCLDGYRQQVAVAVRQPAPDRLDLAVHGDAGTDLDVVAAHVARVLSVDVDATPYDQLGRRDSLVGRVQQTRPGLRPPLFYSAYEAALWSVLSARQPQSQMAGVRDQLSRQYGRRFEVDGRTLAALPLPEQLLGIDDVPGLFGGKVERMHAIAQAALDGRLDTAELRALDPDEAGRRLRELPGIGPFYAELVVVRTLGHTDVLPANEPLCREVAGHLHGSDHELTQSEFVEVAEAWRPWRTWVVVAMRAGAADLGVTTSVGEARARHRRRPAGR